MTRVSATVPSGGSPGWALAQRSLLDSFDSATRIFAERYLRPDGSMHWTDSQAGRVRSDAFYEPLHNWPDAYLLGASDSLLAQSATSWTAITSQLTRYGAIVDGFDQATEWFHLSEGNVLLYGLAAAQPDRWVGPVTHMADILLSPSNYDPDRRQFAGPRVIPEDPETANFPWMPSMAIYGLPLHDVPGITSYEDLKDPELARRMGRAMAERMAHSDVPQNLSATTLITLAHLLTGEERYRTWVLDYVAAWLERAVAHDDIPPDNIGPNGIVGEAMNGKTYGGLYGWAWPHGYYNIGMATIVAGANALLLSGDASYLELPRRLMDRVFGMAEQQEIEWDRMSLPHHWQDRWMAFGDEPARTMVIPYRYGPDGWFDHQPPSLSFPATLWAASTEDRDWQRLEHLHANSGYDWRPVHPFRAKDEGGHEAPWLRFLAGDNPDHPERAMRSAQALVQHRLDLMEVDTTDLERLTDEDFSFARRRFAYDLKHHATGYNPVTTESLLQLMTGSPQRLYNSGLPASQITWADPVRGRPGVPPDVAALVKRVESDSVTVEIVNTSPTEAREVLVRAGMFGEHRFTAVTHDVLDDRSGYPGQTGYSLSIRPPASSTPHHQELAPCAELPVHLPPGRTITLQLAMQRYAATPSLQGKM